MTFRTATPVSGISPTPRPDGVTPIGEGGGFTLDDDDR